MEQSLSALSLSLSSFLEVVLQGRERERGQSKQEGPERPPSSAPYCDPADGFRRFDRRRWFDFVGGREAQEEPAARAVILFSFFQKVEIEVEVEVDGQTSFLFFLHSLRSLASSLSRGIDLLFQKAPLLFDFSALSSLQLANDERRPTTRAPAGQVMGTRSAREEC